MPGTSLRISTLGTVIESLIDSLGGLASTGEILKNGMDRAEIRRAIGSGAVIRVRQGWYARRGLDPSLIAAARVGGRATCSTALALLGVWVRVAGLHVAVKPNACQLRSSADSRHRMTSGDRARIHWDDRSKGGSRLRMPPLDALRDLARCEPLEWVVASANSLIRIRPDLRTSWSSTSFFGPGLASALSAADGICESGTETCFWLRIRDKVARIQRQVIIAGVGRVDFLIGARLIVEIDGFAYHTDPVSFERDRRRDAALSARGYRVLRFSYRQVMEDWPSVEAAVLAAVGRLDHV